MGLLKVYTAQPQGVKQNDKPGHRDVNQSERALEVLRGTQQGKRDKNNCEWTLKLETWPPLFTMISEVGFPVFVSRLNWLVGKTWHS